MELFQKEYQVIYENYVQYIIHIFYFLNSDVFYVKWL